MAHEYSYSDIIGPVETRGGTVELVLSGMKRSNKEFLVILDNTGRPMIQCHS